MNEAARVRDPQFPQLPQLPQLIVGLGNPGPAYAATRHNLGQMVVDHLAGRLHARFQLRGPAHLAEAQWDGVLVYLAKPLAFMNVIGPSVARLLRMLVLQPADLTVVYDEIELPFGRVRGRLKGRHAGHNGVRSVLTALGTEEIRRVKVGIGRPESRDPDRVAEWVLTPFSQAERDALPELITRAADAALALVAPSTPA